MPTETIFYDGHCGLCHRTVRFVLARDRTGELFRFAPLAGQTFQAAVPEEQRRGLPDSLVLRRADGALLVRSAGVLHILRRIGGGWARLAAVLGILPGAFLDFFYDRIARIRSRMFRRPAETCPVISPGLRARFDD